MSSDRLWMFDVDGPIVDPTTRRILVPAVLEHIADALVAGDGVVFNSGRALPWIVDAVVDPLRGILESRGLDAPELLRQVLVVAEKGGVHMTLEDRPVIRHDPDLGVGAEVAREARRSVARHYARFMAVDDAKETMVSVEMAPDMTLERYVPVQARFALEAESLVRRLGLEAKLRVDVTTIAVDIEARGAGKARGADVAIEWLEQRGIRPRAITCFGDSGSDLGMADRLWEWFGPGVPLTYVNVGPASALDRMGELRYTVIHSLASVREPRRPAFAQGTARALERSLC